MAKYYTFRGMKTKDGTILTKDGFIVPRIVPGARAGGTTLEWDWGQASGGSFALSLFLLYHVASKEWANKFAVELNRELVSKLPSEWELHSQDLVDWMAKFSLHELLEKKNPDNRS